MSIVTLLSTSASAEQFTFSRMKFSSSVSAVASTYAGQNPSQSTDAVAAYLMQMARLWG